MDSTTTGEGWAKDLAKARLWTEEKAKTRANFRPNKGFHQC